MSVDGHGRVMFAVQLLLLEIFLYIVVESTYWFRNWSLELLDAFVRMKDTRKTHVRHT